MPGTRGPVPVPLQVNGSPDLTADILRSLDEFDTIDAVAHFPNASRAEIKAALDRLASRSMVEYQTKDAEEVVLTDEGEKICRQGSHEYKVWEAVKSKGRIRVNSLEKAVGEGAKVGQGNAFKLRWIKKDGDTLTVAAEDVRDGTREVLQQVEEHHSADPKTVKEFQKRKLVTTRKVINYTVRKGPRWATEIPVEVTDLTDEMLQNGISQLTLLFGK